MDTGNGIRFVEQGHEILFLTGDDPYGIDDEPVGFIANVARTCYKSERRKLPGWDSPYSDTRIDAARDADQQLVRSLIKNGHHSVLEFGWLAVRFKTSIGVSRELIRHRLLSFAEQSTRYVNFDKRGFEFVMPPCSGIEQEVVRSMCMTAASNYTSLVSNGTKPEIARAVLPLCTATEINAAGNFREWRHVLQLRTSSAAHPEIRALMTPLLEELKDSVPVIFDDIES